MTPFGGVAAVKLTDSEAEAELEHLSALLLHHDWVYYNGRGDEVKPDSFGGVGEVRVLHANLSTHLFGRCLPPIGRVDK